MTLTVQPSLIAITATAQNQHDPGTDDASTIDWNPDHKAVVAQRNDAIAIKTLVGKWDNHLANPIDGSQIFTYSIEGMNFPPTHLSKV